MAKIDLTPMQSQYVDPGYSKVAEVLRDRYDKTLEKKSLLDRAYSQVQVGKGDEFLVNNAKAEGEGILSSYSQQGNWESGSASLAIDDATNSLFANRGVQLGQASYNTRKKEMEFVNNERLNGNNFWDFGSQRFDQHQSYVQDESGNYVENPYQPQSEMELDYNGEMGSLVQSFGVDKYASDSYIDDVYNTYIQSQVGNQDFRRLAILQLRQAHPDASNEELMAMTESNIKERLRSFTRQAEYENTVGDPVGPGGRTQKAEFVTEGIDQNELKTQSSFNSSVNYLGITKSDAPEEEKDAAREELMRLRKDTYTEIARKTGNTAALTEYNNVYSKFQEQADAEGNDRYLQLFETVNMLTSSTNSTFNEVDYGEIASKTGIWGSRGVATGLAIGLAVGSPTGPFAAFTGAAGALTVGAIGLAAGFTAESANQIYDQVKGLNNVRDWERSQEGADWYNPVSWFTDSESDQLMDEVGKLDELNKLMPDANWTQADLNKMQELSKAMYVFKTDKGGDALDEGWKSNGPYVTREGVRFDASPEGAKYRTAFNKSLSSSDPEANFNLTLKDANIRKTVKDNWGSGTEITAAYVADPLRNVPASMKVKYVVGDGKDAKTKFTMLQAKSNKDVSGWSLDIAENMQDYSFVDNERVLNRLQSRKNNGEELTTRSYFDTRQHVIAQRIGLDAAKEQMGYEKDALILEELYNDPGYTDGSTLRDIEGGKEFLDPATNKYVPLDGSTLPMYKNAYRQKALAVKKRILDDNAINGHYRK